MPSHVDTPRAQQIEAIATLNNELAFHTTFPCRQCPSVNLGSYPGDVIRLFDFFPIFRH
jgi:hypothetical protein